MSLVTKIPLNRIKDSGGSLSVLEPLSELNLDFKRIYFLSDIKRSSIRGNHAHKKLHQLFIALAGDCKIIFKDENSQEVVHISENDSNAIYVPPGIWREIYNASEQFILIVFASDIYDEKDYIRNWSEYIVWKKSFKIN